MAKPYLSPVAFRFLAHRGLTVGPEQQPIDENTEPAFVRALEAGATYLEVDVRASRDGLSVVCHDQDMVRVAGNPAKVAELDWQALSVALWRHVVLSAAVLCWLFTDTRVPPLAFMEGLSRGRRTWRFRCAWSVRGRGNAHLRSAATAGRGGGARQAASAPPLLNFDFRYQRGVSRGIAPGSNECGSLNHCARLVFFSLALSTKSTPPPM